MQIVLFGGLTASLVAGVQDRLPAAAQTPKAAAEAAEKDTPAADRTRTMLLKTKVTSTSKEQRIGEILKEFAAQAETKTDQPVMWVYGTGFPHAQKVSFSCDAKPLDAVLDQLLTKAGGGLGYVVVSKDGDKYDGWVRLTTTGERGTGAAPSSDEEATASERLTLAKKLIDAGKTTSAKPLLEILTKKYSATKAGMEAKELLEKLDK